MNVTLYGRTFNFHKVVRQQNSGAVKYFISTYSAVYLRIQKWKNYWNRSTFAKVIVKIKVAPFLMAHGVYLCLGLVGNNDFMYCLTLCSFIIFVICWFKSKFVWFRFKSIWNHWFWFDLEIIFWWEICDVDLNQKICDQLEHWLNANSSKTVEDTNFKFGKHAPRENSDVTLKIFSKRGRVQGHVTP